MTTNLSHDEILNHALLGVEDTKDAQSLIADKIEMLRHYDVLNMNRALAVCFWGRSGSMLVASYLDGHKDVVLLPTTRSMGIYAFFERYQSLSLRDKLMGYPSFSKDFFQGDFPIAAADYYAAVAAIFKVYGDSPAQLLETRRAFFQFLHVAYSLALNRRPATPQPLMVYAQHFTESTLAQRFIEDFPQAQFLYTVRDPISAFDRMFEQWFKYNSREAASWVVSHLTKSDHAAPGMEARTRTIRFEDMHTKTAETMYRLADWLNISHDATLLQSTFNGIPYVVERAGTTWSGPRPEQAARSCRNVAFTDRALLFALFYKNFIAWQYSCPKIFGHPLVRGLTLALVWIVPMKIEIIGARATLKGQVLPSLRRKDFSAAFKSLLRIVRCRLVIMWHIAAHVCRRLVLRQPVLELL